MEIQPIVKWAGGKRWLVKNQPEIFPKNFSRYIEPFLGGGAVFFHLQPQKALLSDLNSELIDVYQAVKSDWRFVVELLRTHQSSHSKEYYYQTRESIPGCIFLRAARTLYLNRTCWNGLYRVNLNGKFNVPIGTKTNVLYDESSFEGVSKALQSSKISCGDFEHNLKLARKGDFVFVDPPYTVKHNLNGFIKYNEDLFKWEDQVRLSKAVKKAVARGAEVLVLNANHESIRELYEEFNQISLLRSNVLASKSEFRGKYEELAIRCWLPS